VLIALEGEATSGSQALEVDLKVEVVGDGVVALVNDLVDLV
jgi:hypothetical protein